MSFFFLVLRIFLLTENIFTYVQTTIGPHGLCKIINTWLDKLCDSISCWLWQKSRRRKAVSSKLVFGQQKAKKKRTHKWKTRMRNDERKKNKKTIPQRKICVVRRFPFFNENNETMAKHMQATKIATIAEMRMQMGIERWKIAFCFKP